MVGLLLGFVGWLSCWCVFFFAVAPQKNQDFFELFGMPFFLFWGEMRRFSCLTFVQVPKKNGGWYMLIFSTHLAMSVVKPPNEHMSERGSISHRIHVWYIMNITYIYHKN